MKEDWVRKYIGALNNQGMLPCTKEEAEKIMNKLIKLSLDYTADLSDCCGDIAKDMANELGISRGQNKEALLIPMMTIAIANMLAWYMGNYTPHYRSVATFHIMEYLVETIESAGEYLSREYE